MVEVKNEKRIGMVDYFSYGNITFQKKANGQYAFSLCHV